jgi:hypothetical protein
MRFIFFSVAYTAIFIAAVCKADSISTGDVREVGEFGRELPLCGQSNDQAALPQPAQTWLSQCRRAQPNLPERANTVALGRWPMCNEVEPRNTCSGSANRQTDFNHINQRASPFF